MFERFTERARQVIVLAQDEARDLGHAYIGTEHILLGLIREEEGVAARVLESSGVELDAVREAVVEIVGEGDSVQRGQIPFTPRAKKVLELALREALSLGQNYIGTEHILLGLVREPDGVAAKILVGLDASAETVRGKVVSMLSGPGAPHRGSASFGTGSFGTSMPPSRWRVPRWEFRIEVLSTTDLAGHREWLDEVGADRWQLAGMLPHDDRLQLIFQRPGLTQRRKSPPPGAPVTVDAGITVVALALVLSTSISEVLEAFSELGLPKSINHVLADDELARLAELLGREIHVTHPEG